MFAGGDLCHQAPARSLRIKLQCGLTEESWGASEPGTCVYTSSVATPAACTNEGLAKLQVRMRVT